MKNRKLLVILVLLFSATLFAQNPVNGGFENGSINSVTDWAGHVGGGTSTVTTTNARTGTYSLAHATTSSTAPPSGQDNISATVLSLPNGWYIHAIGWARGTDANAKAQMRCTINAANTSGTQTANGALNNATQRVTVSALNGTGSTQNSYCRTSSRTLTNTVLTTVYWDDVIMYTSASATPDLTAPVAPTIFTAGATFANSVTFSWTNGSDAATGIQNSIILRTTNLSAALPVLNNQGVYSPTGGASGPNTVATDWTVISTSVASGVTTYTDTPVAAGTIYRYAIIHRDLAYNYSSALDGVITSSPSITSTATGGLWSVGSTWGGGVVPTSSSDVIIDTGATVTLDSAVTRNDGFNTTVRTGATLSTGGFNYTNNNSNTNSTTVNGTFKFDGGSVTGYDFIYGGSSTLVVNTAVTFAGTEKYWPTSNGPNSVTVLSGVLTMNATRTVAGVFQTAVEVALNSPLTLNGTCQLNAGGFFSANSPIYGNASTLLYNTGGTFNRGFEWLALGVGTIGTTPGYPNNVQISNSTTLNYNNGTPLAKAINGNLTIASGSTFDMANGTPASPADLTIAGTVTNNGTFTGANVASSVVVTGDFTNNGTVTLGSVFAADLKIKSNFSNTGTFNGNNRAIWFTKAGTQTVSSSTTLTIPFVVTSGGGTTVQLLSDVIISSSATGTSVISFGNASDVIDINGRNLTIGSTGNPGPITGAAGTFKGSTSSNLTLLGTGSLGTISFTTGSQNLGTFTMNRQAATIGCVMGSALTVNTSLVLTNGLIDLGASNLTLAAAAATSGASTNSYVLAFTTTGGQLVKTFSAAGAFTYPIGDNTSGLDYSPATLTFAGGTYAGTVGVRVVDAVHPSNGGADYLTRYWQVLVASVAPASYTFAGTYISGAGDVTGTEGNCLPQCYNGTSWTDINATPIGSNTCTVSGTSFPYPTNEFSAQTASLYYRSKVSGDWAVAGTWETSLDNVTWSNAAAAPTIAANTITILTGHTVTTTTAVTMDQVYVTGNLNLTGASIAVTVNNGVGTDLTINNGGVVTMSITGSTTSHGWNVPGTSIAVLSGGTYIHNTARAVSLFLDRTTFNTTSTMIYRGSSTLVPAVSLTNRTFGHLRFESTSGALTLSPSFTTTCTSNDFFIGSNVTLNAASLVAATFLVSGNFTNNGTMDNSVGYLNFTFSGTTKTISGAVVPSFDTVNVTGSYTLSTNITFTYTTGALTVAVGGILDNGGEYQITGSASATVTVNGKFITRDAQGFTGTNSAIPTLSVAVGTSSTVEYGGPSQTITAFTTYNNVTVSGTGTKTLLTTPIIMNGDLNVNASTLLVNTSEVIEVKKAVTVALTGATFEIKNNGQLVQNDDIVNGANIYNGSNTGNIIYNRTASSIKGYDYVYWGSPVAGQDIATIYSITSPGYKYFWNPTVSNINTATTGTSGNWQPASGAMTPAKGYIVRGSSSYGMAATDIPAVFTGIPNNGQILTPISRGGNVTASQTGINSATVTNLDDNWNLVANPYPSAIDAISFLSDNSNLTVNGFVWLWRHNSTPTIVSNVFYGTSTSNYNTNDYIAYNSMGSNPAGFNGKIAAGQSFFISMVDGSGAPNPLANQTVIFKNTMRKDRTTSAINNNSQFYKNSAQITELATEKHRIWLDLVDANNNSVSALVGYTAEATLGLDRMYDAFKNTANEKSIYSLVENTTVIIQGRPMPFDQNDQVAIGVRIMSAGDYKIEIAAVDGLFEDNQPIYLEDKELNIIYNLRQNPYSFSSIAGKFDDRFVLRYTNSALGNPDFETSGNVVLAANQGTLTIKSFVENIQEVTVYDVLGRQLFFAKGISSTNFVTSNISASQQALIVKIKLENGVMVSRKIIL